MRCYILDDLVDPVTGMTATLAGLVAAAAQNRPEPAICADPAPARPLEE